MKTPKQFNHKADKNCNTSLQTQFNILKQAFGIKKEKHLKSEI